MKALAPLFAVLLVSAAVQIGCSASQTSTDADETGAADTYEASGDELAIAGMWDPAEEVISAGRGQSVKYNGAGSSCADGTTAGAEKLSQFLKEKFPGISSIGGFACRNIVGGSGLSVHSTGRALDVMVPEIGGDADNTVGDEIAAFLIRNAEQIGVQYIIWDRAQWKPGGDVRSYGGGGKSPHTDHLHVEINEAAGDMQTPFMKTGDVSGSPSNQDSGGAPTGIEEGVPCRSKTLSRSVPPGECVQSKSDSNWYQCAGRVWRNASATSGPLGSCTESHPL
jgi:hypothetical protein